MDESEFVAAIDAAQSVGREVARPLYEELWATATRDGDQYRSCVVAHFMARTQVETEAQLTWHLRALHAADAYLRLDDGAQARYHIEKAGAAASILQDDGYGRMIAGLIARVTRAVTPEGVASAPLDERSDL